MGKIKIPCIYENSEEYPYLTSIFAKPNLRVLSLNSFKNWKWYKVKTSCVFDINNPINKHEGSIESFKILNILKFLIKIIAPNNKIRQLIIGLKPNKI